MAPSMIVRCPRDDDEGGTDCGVLCSDGRSLPELSTGSKNVLDSFGTLKSNQPENFGQRTPPRCRPCSGRNDPTQGNVACKNVRLAAIGGYLSRHQGSSQLADIFVQCPRTGAAISTGLKAEWVVLQSLPRVPLPVRCPACGQIHKWDPADAWTGDDERTTRLSVFGSPNL